MTDAEVSDRALEEAPADEWRSYDEFAAGIDTYRLPNADLTGTSVSLTFASELAITLDFVDADTVTWTAEGVLAGERVSDPYDAVQVRPDVTFVSLPFTSRERQALTLVFSTSTGRALAALSTIQPEAEEDIPQVSQEFWSGVVDGIEASGEAPGPSRDLIGKRNVYRYSPFHLYEHTYMSSQRYMWQCIQGVQRGHGDVDMSTVWKFDDGLYLFCFREFKIAVASVWLHDLGYALRTTGIFLGLNGAGAAEHSRAGGHIYPLGAISYPDVQPI
ncbi:molybdenum cofactor biosynthesis F family protein [Cnuibacter physcomitrellae]|uniref:molybdenum cofactor biosynthesis F family protein n=1 Tax=Cnuibacter physcomitrellae TaxID=1619308 RepID=UPI0021761188|nr:molybdenum cofactor biosynthesis F family protein [Cnuibacter physcomitrellae]MCS5498345.1 molybdenum cofactor biosynthesis F family protein [Cnuibacter physcomitrellae]